MRGRVGWGAWPGRLYERESMLGHLALGDSVCEGEYRLRRPARGFRERGRVDWVPDPGDSMRGRVDWVPDTGDSMRGRVD